MNEAVAKQTLITPITYRIIAIQLLFLGLLFLPEISIFPLKWAVAEYSMVMRTFQEIVDNPAFYGLLMITTIIMLFSFSVNVDDISNETGRISIGTLLIKTLTKIFGIYIGLYILSWFFLIYKLRFMGDVYINGLLG